MKNLGIKNVELGFKFSSLLQVYTYGRMQTALLLQETQSRHKSLLLSRLLVADGSANDRRPHRPQRSMAERVVLDAERQRAIALYRQLKASQSH